MGRRREKREMKRKKFVPSILNKERDSVGMYEEIKKRMSCSSGIGKSRVRRKRKVNDGGKEWQSASCGKSLKSFS